MAKRSYYLSIKMRGVDYVVVAVLAFLAALSIYLRLNGVGVVFPDVI
jgi:energy-coupling factor transporter transmembrane protein EcfT